MNALLHVDLWILLLGICGAAMTIICGVLLWDDFRARKHEGMFRL